MKASPYPSPSHFEELLWPHGFFVQLLVSPPLPHPNTMVLWGSRQPPTLVQKQPPRHNPFHLGDLDLLRVPEHSRGKSLAS